MINDGFLASLKKNWEQIQALRCLTRQNRIMLNSRVKQSLIQNQNLWCNLFVIEEFEHIKPILDTLREGHTIALINIKPLKDKDLIELKRAINKLKKTCDALEGDIAGFGENWIAAVPSFAYIYRGPKGAKGEAPAKAENVEVAEYE